MIIYLIKDMIITKKEIKMKFFTKGDFLKIGLEMIILLKRNGKKQFQNHDVWNPGKNPYKTIAVFNKVRVWVDPSVKSWLKVFVRTWDPRNGKEIHLEPKHLNGSLVFQSRTRFQIEIVDYRNNKRKELLAHYEADENGILIPKLETKPEKEKEKPLSVNINLEQFKKEEGLIEKTHPRKSYTKFQRKILAEEEKLGPKRKRKNPENKKEKFNPNAFTGMSFTEAVKQTNT